MTSPIAPSREEEVERALKLISADLWNAIGNETNAVATKFGIDGWYRLVCEVVQPHRAALASIPPSSDYRREDEQPFQHTLTHEAGYQQGVRDAAAIARQHREKWSNAGGFEGFATGAKIIADELNALLKGPNRES